MPYQPLAGRGRHTRTRLVVADDGDDVVRLEYVGETLARLGGQHLLRVLEDAGAAHDPAAGHVELYVEAAEVVVELGGAEIEAGVPPAQVVVLGDAREPLRRLEQRVVDALRHAVAPAVRSAGKLGVPGDLEGGDRLRRDRRRQRDARQRLIEPERRQAPRGRVAAAATPAAASAAARRGRQQIHGLAVDGDLRDDHPLGVFRRHRQAARHQAAVDVVIQPQHDLGQRFRAVVVEGDGLGAGDRLRRRIEPRADRVVGLQLPVLGGRPPRAVARARLVRLADGVGHRHVAPDGPRHRLLRLERKGTDETEHDGKAAGHRGRLSQFAPALPFVISPLKCENFNTLLIFTHQPVIVPPWSASSRS